MTVLDTHALVWWLSEPSKLSTKARRAIQAATQSGPLVASAASIFEIATLVRRGRLQLALNLDRWLADLHSLPELAIEPITSEIAARAGAFDAEMHVDPIDRLIAATAIVLNAPLVSADTRLRESPWVRTVW